MTRVRIEQYQEYGEEGALRLSEWRVFPCPMPGKTVRLIVGEGEVDLTPEGCTELAAALRTAALDG